MKSNKPLSLTHSQVLKWQYSGSITSIEFRILHFKILDEVKIKWIKWDENNPSDKKEPFPKMNKGFSEKLHGFGKKFDPKIIGNEERVSVESVLQKDEDVQQLINLINYDETYNLGQHIYKSLYLKFNPKVKKGKEKPDIPDSIDVSRQLLLHVYFVFLGYRGIEDFREKYQNGKVKLPETFDKETNKNIEYDHYLGFFYSEFSKGNPLKTFLLRISKEKIKQKKLDALEIGYHNIGNHDDIKFVGTADLKGGYLQVNLENNGKQLNIVGVLKSDNQRIVKASIQSVSSFSRLLSSEAVLVKMEGAKMGVYLNSKTRNPVELQIINEDDLRNIAFYLAFKRNSFHIENNVIQRFENLEVKGNKVADYEYLVGQYRIWNFTFDKHSVVQSRFVINSKGTGLLEPYIAELSNEQEKHYPKRYRVLRNNSRKQNCVISIDTISSKIWVLAYPESEKASIIANIAIFDYPEPRFSNYKTANVRPQAISGTFSSIGVNPHGIMAGYIIMIKDPREFEVREFSQREAIEYAENENLSEFHKSLYDLWRDKLWDNTGTKKH